MVEGNYLLLDEPGWRDLHLFARCRIFIDTSEERIEKDVIQRYIIGGQKSPSQASKHYFQSDRINNIRIRDHQLSADIRLNASWVFWGNAPKR
jgi:pantothenate kinase